MNIFEARQKEFTSPMQCFMVRLRIASKSLVDPLTFKTDCRWPSSPSAWCSNLVVALKDKMQKGGPLTLLYELCKRCQWPMLSFETVEWKPRKHYASKGRRKAFHLGICRRPSAVARIDASLRWRDSRKTSPPPPQKLSLRRKQREEERVWARDVAEFFSSKQMK
ncbi:hypothetical protein OPV22_024045 [Ensete ventricosum]|uniref:Uncharacterized protein n=1 Tax=Ensete ventricosum TaxID=4639 RepID=A0AAV8QS14_ENSVE|nr:hypothetical protein OPV22_024045 [Ensete ventricosum]